MSEDIRQGLCVTKSISKTSLISPQNKFKMSKDTISYSPKYQESIEQTHASKKALQEIATLYCEQFNSESSDKKTAMCMAVACLHLKLWLPFTYNINRTVGDIT